MENTTLVTNESELSSNNILIVDDTPANLRLLSKTLIQEGYQVRCAVNGSMALLTIEARQPDLILLDINMPDMNGFEICEQLKQADSTKDIPIIFVSALNEIFDKVRAFEVGALDYISKPFQIPEVLSRVSNQLKIQNLKRQLIKKNQLLQKEVRNRIAAEEEIRKLNFVLEQRVIARTSQLRAEINERQQAQKELEFLAWNDSLTKLPNRLWVIEKLKKLLALSHQNKNYKFATIILDCNRFKIINDSLGRLAGDKLLAMLAQRLKAKIVGKNISINHFGGDQFAIILEEIQDKKHIIDLTKKIQQYLSIPFIIEQREIFIGFNIGIVIGNSSYLKVEDIFRDADLAIQKAKKSSSQYYQIFDATIQNHALEILEIETDLRLALQRQEFHLNYQPIICLKTGKIRGFETLVRWNHPTKGFISPDKFIPIAEQNNLIIPLGMWILRQTCKQISIWQDQLASNEDVITISANISPKQFEQEDFIEQLDQIIDSTQINVQHLKLEITETLLMNNAEIADQVITQLKARQIKLAIDDFGTGYSSLSYLDRFPVDTLKIDRSFVSRLDEKKQASTIVKATLDLAHNLGFDVVAEGVETLEQVEQLKNWGCEFAQGYYYAKPLSQKSACLLLQKNS